MTVWSFITETITAFNASSCFLFSPTYVWFIVAVLGIMIRSDDYGIASCIRSVGIRGKHYETFDHFFHSLAWKITPIRTCWHSIVSKYANLPETNGRISLLIDHTKKSKEGRRMPAVRKLCQESETQSKPEYIHGHLFGGLSVVASRIGDSASIVAIPLILQLQNGISHMLKWLDMECDGLSDAAVEATNNMKRAVKDLEISTESSITQMIILACRSAQWLKRDANIIADRAFLTLKALNTIDEYNQTRIYKVQIVTRCKKNLGVYTKPQPRPAGKRGATRKKGDRVDLSALFSMESEDLRNLIDPGNVSIRWSTKTMSLYGKDEKVTYVAFDLVWARAHCRTLRFALVKYGAVETILVTTDLNMDAETIVKLYETREKIEVTFRELNQRVNAFSARFWTKSMPKLDHFRKSTDPDPLEAVTSPSDREKVVLAVRAVELYAALSCIAMGILQIISLSFEWNASDFGWQRTPTKLTRPSEECIQKYLRNRIGEKILRNHSNSIGTLLSKFLDESVVEEIEKIMLTA